MMTDNGMSGIFQPTLFSDGKRSPGRSPKSTQRDIHKTDMPDHRSAAPVSGMTGRAGGQRMRYSSTILSAGAMTE